MSVMGHLFYYPRKTKIQAIILAVIASVLLSLVFSNSSMALMAKWSTSAERNSIVLDNITFTGPHTNGAASHTTGTGWSGGQGEIYFETSDKSSVIYFPKGTDVKKDVLPAKYASIKEESKPCSGNLCVGGDKKRTIGSEKLVYVMSAETGSAVEAMRNTYSSSINGYKESLCNDRNSAVRNECRAIIDKSFERCWGNQVETATLKYDNAKPGNIINIGTLSTCMVAESDYGKANGYREFFTEAQDKANQSATNAFNENKTQDGEGKEESSCKIDGIGWIICPISNFFAALTDQVYDEVEKLLEVKVFSNTLSNDSLRKGWNTMLGIANVAFVIAFIIIIYSQLTGGGFSNYSIKKMLPRLVISAILVNVSFWICAIAVDISNILGSSLQDIFTNLAKSVGTNESIPTWQQVTVNILSAGALTGGLAAGIVILTSASLMYAMLGVLWPLIVAAVFAVLIALVLLTVRQGLIVILVVISPLAFVAFLLPNTEKWFTKWRDLFVSMLMLFPIISIVFGGSQYAARLIMSTSPEGAVVIMALALQVIPLAFLPLILKFSGGLLGRIGGMINNPTKGPFDRLKNAGAKRIESRRGMYGNRERTKNLERAKGVIDSTNNERLLGKSGSRRRRAIAAVRSRGATSTINQSQKESVAKAVAEEAGQVYFANQVMEDAKNNGKFIKSITGKSKDEQGDERNSVALQASAQSAVNKIDSQDKESRAILFRAKFDPREIDKFAEEFEHAVASGDTASMRASANILMNSGSKGLEKLQDSIVKMEVAHPDKMGDTTAGSDASLLRQDINAAGLKGKNNALAMFAYTNETLGNIQSSDSTYNELTPKEITGQSTDNLRVAAQNMTKEFAQSMLDNEDVSKDLSSSKSKILQEVAAGRSVSMPTRKGQQPGTPGVATSNTNPAPSNNPSTPNSAQQPTQTTPIATPAPSSTQQPTQTAPSGVQTAPTQQAATSNPTVLNIPHNTPSSPSTGKHAAAPVTTPTNQTPTPSGTSFTTQNITVNNNQTVNESGIRSVPLSGRRSSTGQYTNPTQPIPQTPPSQPDYLPPKTANSDPTNIPREFFE